MHFGRRIAIHKSVKETNLIKFIVIPLFQFIRLIFIAFTERNVEHLLVSNHFHCIISILWAFTQLHRCALAHFLALWSHFGYTECHFQHLFYFISFALFVQCHSLPLSLCMRMFALPFLLNAADIWLFVFFFSTRFNGWWYEKHVLCLLATVIIACVTPNIQSN